MPDKRKHRGQHPADKDLFATKELPKLRTAVEDLSLLLSKGYSENASLKLVGDRFRLKERQRMAVRRCSCAAEGVNTIESKELVVAQMRNQHLELDGLNVLIIVESALSGGLILKGMDQCYKDLASIHSTYRKVMETEKAIQIIGESMEELGIQSAIWFLDRPVSNSGRLKQLLLEHAKQNDWDWEVELVYNPDTTLIERQGIVASSDSMVVKQATQWVNLTGYVIDQKVKEANVINLRREVK